MTVIGVLCLEYPPLPSTMTEYVPGEPLHESVDLSDPPPIGRLFGETEQEITLLDVVAVRLTVAENPFSR